MYFNSETTVKFILNFLLIGVYAKIDEMGSLLLFMMMIVVVGQVLAQVRISSVSVIGFICPLFHDRSVGSFSRVSNRASELSYLYSVHFI